MTNRHGPPIEQHTKRRETVIPKLSDLLWPFSGSRQDTVFT
jgi:hypothetical protein